MGKTVKQLLGEIDSYELSEWMAYDRLSPIGDEWRQTGLICATTANVWKTKGKPLDAEDFMPIVKAPQTPTEARRAFEGMLAGVEVIDTRDK